jgi:hypothetical protein
MLADLDDDDRTKFVRELAAELTRTESTDAAPPGTSEENPDAGPKATSVPTSFAARQQMKRRLITDAIGIEKD